MSKFQQMIQVLEENNTPEEDIAILLTEIIKAASMMLYTQGLATFSEEQQSALSAADNEEVANALIDSFYELNTGKTPAAAIEEYQESFAEEFLKNYQPASQNSAAA